MELLWSKYLKSSVYYLLQLYIYPDPQMLSQSPYLQNSQLVQRPTNNVVPTIPPSSASYYSASAGKVNLFIHGFVLKNAFKSSGLLFIQLTNSYYTSNCDLC